MASTNPADRRRPLNIDDLKTRFPPGQAVVIENPRATAPIRAEVVEVRYAGTPGSRGHSLFVYCREDRGPNFKPRERAVRPAHLRAA